MNKFEELSTEPVKERETKLREYWKDIDLLTKSVETREGNEPFVFYEGPPTANGEPGIHHVMARTLKDLTLRYRTMDGYLIRRKAGWDTHGLPVEIEVEKELGLTNKQEIEDYGIAEFNEKCKDSVFKYEGRWREMTERMAFEVDMDDPYITMDNDYIESVWWILDKFFQEGLIYEGHKILPYCTRCGTGLASHEVAQGYEEITSETVIAKFKLKDKENEYFLAWTTTPWTLPSNVSLTVHPDVDYVKVKQEDEIYYLAKSLVEENLGEDYEVLEEMKGKDLEHIKYEQLIPFVKTDEEAFYVTVDDYVTMDDGTGIVHSAPAFGEEDYEVGQKYGLPVLNPVSQDGKFITTPWEGKFVMDADPDIVEWLRHEGKMYKKQRMTHNYPHCWRCKTPLLYYANPSWYIEMTALKDQLIEQNNTVNWYPDHVGERRFGNWLDNLNDWAISRSRYWGTPFPVWRCDDCGHLDSVGSRKELVERAIEDIDESIELHKPYVDEVHLKCDECNGSMTRELDVIDVWFDSGAMPFAQHHYPFENKEAFEEQFPADFICEGIDQTRGWFYSLIAISTFITGKAPYKNVLVNDLILDKEGKKMSKSVGNTVDPFEMFDEFGADVLRWYFMYVSPPWNTTRFDVDGLREIESRFFNTLRNTYNFFSLYANTDELDPSDFFVPYEDRPEIDKWLLSKYNSLIVYVRENMEIYEYTRVVRAIQDFVIEDLSNWYIRRNRRRFWSPELNDDKRAVYNTTHEVLVGLTKLIAPVVPFISEELFQKLVDGKESVHLEYYPDANEELIDIETEEKMDLVRDLVGLGRASREVNRLKVRQPLNSVLLDGKYEDKISDLVPLIKEELNVKEVIFETDLAEFMNFSLQPNYREVGSILGKKVQTFAKVLKEVDAHEMVEKLEEGKTVPVDLDGETFNVEEDHVQINISAKEGFEVSMEKNKFVILDTTLTDELRTEGFAREFVSKVQQMRRANDYDILDNIRIYYNGSDAIQKAVSEYEEYIKDETLALSIELVSEKLEEEDLNGEMTGIRLEKIK